MSAFVWADDRLLLAPAGETVGVFTVRAVLLPLDLLDFSESTGDEGLLVPDVEPSFGGEYVDGSAEPDASKLRTDSSCAIKQYAQQTKQLN